MIDADGKWRTTPSREVAMIDVTDVDLVDFAKDCYEISAPQGMGHLHYREGGLEDSEAAVLVRACEGHPAYALSMDYVFGRAVKMWVFRSEHFENVDIRLVDASGERRSPVGDLVEGRLLIRDYWLDHTPEQFAELLEGAGIDPQAFPEA